MNSPNATPDTSTVPGPPQHPTYLSVTHWLRQDRVVLSAVLLCGLLLGYQLVVTALRPSWASEATVWLLTVLAWPELAVVVYLSLRLSRTRRPDALAWWLVSAALLAYAIARTAWTVDDYLVYHTQIPFPSFPDFLFALQYPLFFLAILLIPRTHLAGPRLLTILDSVLFLGAAAALTWYFLLEPIFGQSRLSPLARAVGLAYPLGDLLILFGLTAVLLRPSHYRVHRLVMGIMIAAVACLIVGDSTAVALVLHPNHVFRRGAVPDLFWLASDLLIPLAALVRLRILQSAPPPLMPSIVRAHYRWDDVLAALRFFFPFVAALLASIAILLHTTLDDAPVVRMHEYSPFAVSFGLLLLAIVRQAITFVENTRLQREREEAHATARAMRELVQRKDAFLSIISHELKTPLASLRGYLELLTRLLTRRFASRQPQVEAAGEGSGASADEGDAALVRAQIALAEANESVRRLSRLVDDLLDDAQIRDGRFALYLEPCDLGTIVRTAVEAQQALTPERTLRLVMLTTSTVLVNADALRIGQVVTNYLTNALKYSKEDQAVEVRLEVEDAREGGKASPGTVARVSVRDEGIGVPLAAQGSIWERFQQLDGNEVQSGSGIGLGIGLSISKRIIDGHHGQVGIESTPGEGATFWFTLPCISHTPVAPENENANTVRYQDKRAGYLRPLKRRRRVRQ